MDKQTENTRQDMTARESVYSAADAIENAQTENTGNAAADTENGRTANASARREKKKEKRPRVLQRIRSRFAKKSENENGLPVFIIVTAIYVGLLFLYIFIPDILFTYFDYAAGGERTGRFILLDFGIRPEAPYIIDASPALLKLTATKFGGYFADIVFLSRYLFLGILPTFLIYLAAHRPFGMSEAKAKTCKVCGIILTVLFAAGSMAAEAYSVNRVYGNIYRFNLPLENSFVLSFILLVLANVALYVGYLKWAKGLRQYWYVIICPLFTLLAPVLGAAVLVIVMALYFVAVVLFLIRGLFSVAKTGYGDNSFVKSFKAGYRGESIPFNYAAEITNAAGCAETLYSDDGRDWYDENGQFKGTSEDGGRTMILK